MSRENVEVVRGIYDALAWGDLYSTPVYQGHEGGRQVWRETLSVFAEVDVEVEQLIDAGDQVVAVIREREVGRTSGAPVEMTHLAVWTLADGEVTKLQVFDDRQRALEAAGLRE
jgi:ketosteroid isomerase-like protein